MNDGIIKGDGTSRKMKATLPATYEEFKQAVAAGEQTLDVVFNAPGWEQQPTFLNKQNLLQDVTAAILGMGSDAVPDDAFSKLIELANSKCKIETGNYKGTGTAGIDNPNSLTFSSPPKFIIFGITDNAPSNSGPSYSMAFMPCYALTSEYPSRGNCYTHLERYNVNSGNLYFAKVDGNTVYWYHNGGSDTEQLNLNSRVYYYFAIL